MIKRILVPLDPSPYTDAAVRFACNLAKRHDAQVAGLVVLDIPGIEKSVGPVPLGGSYYAELHIAGEQERFQHRIDSLLDRFKEKCGRAGVRASESERQGSPAQNILEESNFYDCLVIGLRTFFAHGTSAGADDIYGTLDDRYGDSLEKVMKQTVVPIFAVPMNWHAPRHVSSALIAFNGTLPSVRALHQFAWAFSPDHVTVTVLTSCEDMARGRFILDQASGYLTAHGFERIEKEWTSVDIRNALKGTLHDKADLIVLGGHSKSSIFDFMVGNVCRDLIERAEKPLLIAH